MRGRKPLKRNENSISGDPETPVKLPEIPPVLKMLGLNEESINELLRQFTPMFDEYISKKVSEELNKQLPPFLEQLQNRIMELLRPAATPAPAPVMPPSSVNPPADGQNLLQNPALLEFLMKMFLGGGGGSDLEKTLETAVKLRQLFEAISPRSAWDEVGPRLLVRLLEKSLTGKEERELIKKLEGEGEE